MKWLTVLITLTRPPTRKINMQAPCYGTKKSGIPCKCYIWMLHENILIKLTANYIFVNKLLVLKSVNVKTSKINMTCRIAYVHVNLDAV